MTQDGTSKDDVKVPEGEIGGQITAGFDEGKDLLVTIVSSMGEEQVSLARLQLVQICAYESIGYLIQGSPEGLLVRTHAILSIFPVSPSCTCILRPSIYRPYGCHSVCMYFPWLDSACVLHSPLFRCRNELHGLRS
jgi:Eukaryotic elongation factor 5A hypusine, DNA-binding OB fold